MQPRRIPRQVGHRFDLATCVGELLGLIPGVSAIFGVERREIIVIAAPAGIDLADCDGGEFRSWVDWGGSRYTEPGQRDMLWILDVDGVPLVIDAALGEGTTRRDRAERTEIVESTRIEPL